MKRLFLCMERELVVVKERYGNYEAAYHLQNMQPTCIAVDPFHTQVLLSLNLKIHRHCKNFTIYIPFRSP